MNSANSETKNSTRNTHSAQVPRRLRLKFSQRRRLSGDSANRRNLGGGSATTGEVGSGVGAVSLTRASTLDLPRLEIDPRIDPGVGEIGDQVHHETDQRKNIERGEHHRIIAVEHAFKSKQA